MATRVMKIALRGLPIDNELPAGANRRAGRRNE